MAFHVSGRSSPSSAGSTTLTNQSAKNKLAESLTALPVGQALRLPASALVERMAKAHSSSVFLYDLAAQSGIGAHLAGDADDDSAPPVVPMQTRPGAGLILLGRLSEGPSKDTKNGCVLTAFTTPHTLERMGEYLADLPDATPDARLVIQVPAVTNAGEDLSLSPTLNHLATAIDAFPDSVAVIFSSGAQETVNFAEIAYKTTSHHVVHVYDHYGAAREVTDVEVPAWDETASGALPDVLFQAGVAPLSYHGDPNATHVLVVLNGPLATVAKTLIKNTPGLGLVVVRVLRPWDRATFLASIPESTTSLHVVDDASTNKSSGPLFTDVFAAVAGSARSMKGHHPSPAQLSDCISSIEAFHHLLKELGLPQALSVPSLSDSRDKKLLFYSTPSASVSALPSVITHDFLSNKTISARMLAEHDAFSKVGGVTRTRILLSPKTSEHDELPLTFTIPSSGVEAHFVGILDQALLKTHDVFGGAKQGATVLINSGWTADELISNIAPGSLSQAFDKELHLFLIDTAAIAKSLANSGNELLEIVIAHIAFLKLYMGRAGSLDVLQQVATAAFSTTVANVDVAHIASVVWADLAEVRIPDFVAVPEAEGKPLKSVEFNTIVPDEDRPKDVLKPTLGTLSQAIKALLFAEALSPPAPSDSTAPHPALRPDVPERTYVLTCTVNRRLTPREYERNVFHMEFDTTGTGLQYAIGEALGIHGWNDADDVREFCAWYGLDPERAISIPVPESGGTLRHVRTVFQALQQQVDLFGRPPKSFYAALSAHATKREDRMALHFIGAPEGSATFKKLGEKDTVTFADVLQRYESARPGIEDLCEMIGDIKPRHYSIASAQSAVGDRVDLLIVTVEWATPSGSPRYGQCTRYLAGMKVGQKVTVSIKPSVMKLPPDNAQPIIMAGLGTGAAPFRAFMQHRAHLAAQGIHTGPLVYYFGSRHRSEEYLYGEEIEAYLADNVLTHTGLAFSRDQARKVYIQHKMQSDAEMLATMLDSDAKGVFYLCGPTWPVPDVYEALVGALVKYRGKEVSAAAQFIEDLKEEERYVLEVY
ncbi:hypothetical protein EXIGLDRAFT_663402 [Exidia glandulosa HHB12029]|uniref:assimilatory sulfite reductase (NADPH) n=1 Tax=Exidia glandulosa HHB12029 TaxID=1314781 RepID=A0A165QS45_EXIGL|nr:hypothetical protein EXIGLDRAFT_663402 [Exidia glandulosa HHB12029]